MARPLRHSISGGIYHVMLRGNNGQSIFSSDQERRRFCLLMEEGVDRFGHKILAFCFMTNHIHLVIKQGDISLSRICQNLAFRYAKFYNEKHGTIGHLFQGRFKSILVIGTKYVKQLIKYVHLNPVRAGMVSDLNDYHWSSHKGYLMPTKYPWLSVDEALIYFGSSKEEIRKNYRSFMTSPTNEEDHIDFKKGMLLGIIADDLVIKNIRENFFKKPAPFKPIKIDLPSFLEKIASRYQTNIQSIKAPGKNRNFSQIRAIAAFLIRYTETITLSELSNFFERSDSSLSRAAALLEIELSRSERLHDEIIALKNSLADTIHFQTSNVKC